MRSTVTEDDSSLDGVRRRDHWGEEPILVLLNQLRVFSDRCQQLIASRIRIHKAGLKIEEQIIESARAKDRP